MRSCRSINQKQLLSLGQSCSRASRTRTNNASSGSSSQNSLRALIANPSADEPRFVAIHRLSTDTSVALIMAKTASPFLRFIRFTEPVVMIEVTSPAAVLMTISETTLSDTICSIVPGKRLRMLVFMTS